jgi:hypothetical protein
MSTGINITSSSGITVGTTPVTSGTDGRVFFQAGGVIQQDSAFFWDNTNKRLGVGATPASTVRLDIRAQGALSTDIAFRVRNSANTSNLTSIDGTGLITSANSLNVTLTNSSNITRPLVQDNGNNVLTTHSRVVDNNVFVGFGNIFNTGIENSSVLGHGNTIGINALRNAIVGLQNSSTGNVNEIFGRLFSNTGNNNILIGSRATSAPLRGIAGSNFIWLGHGSEANSINCSSALFTYFNDQANPNHVLRRRGNIALLGEKYQITQDANTSNGLGSRMDVNAENTFTVHNGTAPSINITDAFQQYSSDITAGNAAPHFRTENGSIVKLYQETAVTNPQGIADALTNLGVLASSTIVPSGYTITLGHSSNTMLRNTTWTIGGLTYTVPSTTNVGSRRVAVPKSGVVKKVSVMTNVNGVSSSSSPSPTIQLFNNTTSTATTITGTNLYSGTAPFTRHDIYTISATVAEGDEICVQAIIGNVTTEPTQVTMLITLWIEEN